ncbi:MAG: hypothetical protein NTV01_03125 [Bacteroidia bacterium]|nr:hypothetical protein [Bacteroidia bacterium]
MKNLSYSNIIELIRKKEIDIALKNLDIRLSKDCFPLIRAKNRSLTRHEVLGVFYYAFLDLCDRIAEEKFQFVDDSSFVSYFKTSCVNQTYKLSREQSIKELILPVDILENLEVNRTLVDVGKDFFNNKMELYGIELQMEDIEDEISGCLNEVVKVFHTLGDKCKFLIVLKFFLKLSHQEISDSLNLFYEIKSPDVSKTELYRCIGNMKRIIAA